MKEIFDFLKALTLQNDRDWMTANKPWYKAVRKEFDEIVSELIHGIAIFDPNVMGLEPKDCIFRLNRDVRFSRDKSPYKTHFGAAITPGGRKSPLPTYYLHIQPGSSMLAGGVYMPPPDVLAGVRQEIDYNAAELHRIIGEPDFERTWGAIAGEELKTAPRGYPKDHPDIELIRKKSFVVTRPLTDAQCVHGDFITESLHAYRILYPFNRFLSVAIR